MANWKGIRQNMLRKNNANPLKIELYNLATDIGESKDVAAENPQVVAQIRQLMKEQHLPSELFPIRPLDQ
jgi:arylsulfatase